MRLWILIALLFSGPAAWSAPPKLADFPQPLVVATWNLEWFFDSNAADNQTDLAKAHAAPSAAEWAWRVKAVAEAIARLKPTILCLQEIENRQVLADVVATLQLEHKLRYEIAFVEGEDAATEQDVGILWQAGLVECTRFQQTPAQKSDPQLYGLSKHLAARFRFGAGADTEELLLVTFHLRAGKEGEPFRVRQARQLWAFLEAQRLAGVNLLLVGDTNTDHRWEHGEPPQDLAILRRLDTIGRGDDLIDLHQHLPADGRKTHLGGGQFDRILVASALLEDGPGRDFVFRSIQVRKDLSIRGRADFSHGTKYWSIPQAERDISDHYPLVAEFEVK